MLSQGHNRRHTCRSEVRGFSSVVTSAVAPMATGWSEPVPGRDSHSLWIGAFSRRTNKFTLPRRSD